MAYDDANGILYATDHLTKSLYTVNTTTGEATLVGPTGVTVLGRVGLAYNEESSRLYMNVGFEAGQLYSVNTTTGLASLIGNNGFLFIDGLAWRPPTEACCLPDGTCADLPVPSCLGQGGNPQGRGTDCDSVDCLVACCFFSGVCAELPLDLCVASDATSQGLGSTCATTTCPAPCGDPDAGNCFTPNGTPGCNKPGCCLTVCSDDPFCCTDEWDQTCADLAQNLCGDDACPGTGGCDVENGTPGCDDTVCCMKVCHLDAFCCDNEWDQLCADRAADTCELVAEACCFSDRSCQDLTPAGCATLGGKAQGAGTDCATSSCVPPVEFFLDEGAFEVALGKAGKTLKGFEDFSENILPPDSVDVIDDPLDANTVDRDSFPKGILIDNLTFQSNVGGADSSQPNPQGPQGLLLATTGFSGATADVLAPVFSTLGFDILSGPPAGDNHTALALRLMSFGNNPLRVDVYDKDNNLMGTIENVPAPLADGGFLGIVAVDGNTIGRVNIWDSGGLQGVYDVAAYLISACPADLTGDGEVNAADLANLLGKWGPYAPCPPSEPSDFNQDCVIDAADLAVLLGAWGPCP